MVWIINSAFILRSNLSSRMFPVSVPSILEPRQSSGPIRFPGAARWAQPPRLGGAVDHWGQPRIPSGFVKIAIENGHRNSDFSQYKMWYSIVILDYQRVSPCWGWSERSNKHGLMGFFPTNQSSWGSNWDIWYDIISKNRVNDSSTNWHGFAAQDMSLYGNMMWKQNWVPHSQRNSPRRLVWWPAWGEWRNANSELTHGYFRKENGHGAVEATTMFWLIFFWTKTQPTHAYVQWQLVLEIEYPPKCNWPKLEM